MDNVKKHYALNPDSIDQISQEFFDYMQHSAFDRRDAIRLRILLEEMLMKWMKRFDEGTTVSLVCGSRFTRRFIRISVNGPEYNPMLRTEDQEDGDYVLNNLLAQSGLGFAYSYVNGRNTLTLNPQISNPKLQMLKLLFALVAAVVAGFVTMLCPQNVISVAQAITDPLFNALLGVLNAIAGPMIFLAICRGILNLGDISRIGRIARKTLLNMLLSMIFVGVGAAIVLVMLQIFPISGASDAQGTIQGFNSIYQMFLNILPQNIVQPFSDGRMLQIIFIAVCVGIAMLILGERISTLRSIINQANDIIELMMSVIGKMVPVFIFLSVYTLILSDVFSHLSSALCCVVIVIAGSYVMIAFYAAIIALKYKVRFTLIIKKLFKTHIVALTTASSAAAFASNLETCENELGISRQLTRFAVPLGQVLYMPSGVIMFIAAAFTMAANYQIPITPSWIATLVIVSTLLAMATSPIPGGSLTFYSVLLLQMGIPAEALALLLSIDMLLDYVITASDISCLQLELVLDAAKLNMLDIKILRNPETVKNPQK